MKRILPLATALLAAAFSPAMLFSQDAQGEKAAPDAAESLADRISYAYGVTVARQLSERDVELNVKEFIKAFRTVFADGEVAMSDEEINAAFEEMASLSEAAAKKEGLDYLDENKKKEGVTTTDSGLQYEVIEKGDGDKPVDTDQVTVHYHGTLVDGTVFDSSVERGEPATFGLNQVIPGWTEGVQLMPKGSKYRFVIPSELAYGARGAGEVIKPHSTLVFEVELLEINGE